MSEASESAAYDRIQKDAERERDLTEARERARLSVLRLTEKDKKLLEAMKIKA
jgi:hypothetical protein